MRWLQAMYYVLGGLWPIADWRSFTAVSGPKPDRFQTEVAGALFAAIGVGLLRKGTALLALCTAVGCLIMDRKYARSLRWVFQIDAALNAAFASAALRRLLLRRN